MPDGVNDPVQYAHAKLTRRLHITGVRADGYHLLDAEMVSLDFCDLLTFSEGDGIEILGDEAGNVPTGPENLVSQALVAAGRSARVCLEKRIPPGAGLGGGSSNAAAALRWAGVTDPEVAAKVGADVPFCLRGGRAHVSGVGEVLEELPYEEREFTLLIPPLHVSTLAVYRAYDALSVKPGNEALNHLEAAALAVEPSLGEWRDILERATGQRAVLAGSGSTWFVEGTWPRPESLPPRALWVGARSTKALPLA